MKPIKYCRDAWKASPPLMKYLVTLLLIYSLGLGILVGVVLFS